MGWGGGGGGGGGVLCAMSCGTGSLLPLHSGIDPSHFGVLFLGIGPL